MEKKHLSWQQMKVAFPDEWLVITDFELDKFGTVVTGVVERHARDMDVLIEPDPISDRDIAFHYTGESTFAGLRSHAQHNHTL